MGIAPFLKRKENTRMKMCSFVKKLIAEKAVFRRYAWWVGSYSVIILISIVINLVGYIHAIGVIERELAKTNAAAIEHTKNIFDNYWKEVESISYNLVQSNSIAMLDGANVTPGKRTEYAGHVIRDIANSVNNSQIVENIYLILRERNICIDAGSISSLDNAFNIAFSDCYSTREAWMTDLFEMNMSGLKFLEDKNGKQRMFFCRIYVNTRSFLYKPATVAIMTEVKTERVNEILHAMESAEGETLSITSDTAGLLFSSRQMEQWPLSANAAGTYVQNVFGQKQVVSITNSAIKGLQYVRLLPNSTYLKDIRAVRTSFVLCYLLCIVVGGALAWLFSKINIRSKRRMEDKIAQQNRYMREEVLRQMVEGKLKSEPLSAAFLEEYDLQLPGKYFVVAVIDAMVSDEAGEEEPDVLEKLRRPLMQYLSPMLGSGMHAYFCMSQSMAVVVFNLSDEETAVLRVCNTLSRLRSQLREDLNLSFICAVSRLAIGIEGLPEAMDEAVEAINSRFLGQEDAIFIYDDDSEISGRYVYSAETEHKLINFLTLGDRENAMRVIEEVFSHNITVKKINLSMLRVLTSEITSTLLKVAAQIDSDESLDFKELYLFSSQVYNIKQIDQAKHEILKYISLLCALNAPRIHAVGDARCAKIQEYIAENYNDPNLNVNRMAELFGISASWMSHYFKEQVGMGMADYIVKYRLKKAKEMIARQDKPIKQIAEETGFSGVPVFRRAFKRFEGIAPSQYKEYLTERERL